jgi:hypothetical protein
MFKVGRELLAERGGLLGIQIDLIVGAVERKPDGLLGWAASEVSSRTTLTFWAIFTFPPSTVPAPYLGRRPVTVSNAADQAWNPHAPRWTRRVSPTASPGRATTFSY